MLLRLSLLEEKFFYVDEIFISNERNLGIRSLKIYQIIFNYIHSILKIF